jgi:tetratricopeptide (TPR) repeat protein
MKLRSYPTCFLGCCLLLTLVCTAQEAKPLHAHVSLPSKNWAVVLDLPGFTVKTLETKADGRRYFLAQNDATKVVVSLTIEQADRPESGSSCRASLEQKTRTTPFKIQDVRFLHRDDVEIMQYLVPEFNGQRVNQQSIFACRFYDNSYIDLHISKINYSPEDEPSLISILDSMHIDHVGPSSKELFAEASRFFLQQDYKGAIAPYSQALELEKVNPKLDKTLWYVLIDNLGMSYGITGDLRKAKETFEYGVSNDPKYPLFYYNLACTYAEMRDASNAGNYLKKAFEYKTNVLPGESMPDPRTDDSFKELMKDKDFRELADALAGAR